MVSPFAARQPLHRAGDILGGVVDAVIEAELETHQSLQPIVARHRCQHSRTSALGKLNDGDADTAHAGLHQQRLARFQPAEFEETVMRRGEADGDCCCHSRVECIGNGPGVARRHAAQRRIRTPDIDGDDALMRREMRHLSPTSMISPAA